MKYTISIACFNRLDVTKKCVDSIRPNSNNYEIIFTDNGSSDGTLKYLRELDIPHKWIITNTKNMGFGVAHNRALRIAKGKYFIVLNNDVVVTDGWLDRMAEKLEKDQLIQVGVANISNSTLNNDCIGYRGDAVEYIEGSCMMMRTLDARHHGLFSEDYKIAYFEDADLSLRLRERGGKIGLIDLPMGHNRASTSSTCKTDIPGYFLRNKEVFKSRWSFYIVNRHFRRKILIHRRASYGDVYNLIPVIKAIKSKYPQSEITLSSQCFSVLRDFPYIDHFVTERPATTTYDIVYDFDGAYEKNPHIHMIDAYAKSANVQIADYKREYPETETVKQLMNHYRNILGKYVVFHTGKTWVTREWKMERFINVANHLRGLGYRIVEMGDSSTQFGLGADLILKNEPWGNVVACLKMAAFFIGVDSVISNLSLAQGVMSFILFGCVDPKTRIAPGDIGYPIEAENVGCRHCRNWITPPVEFVNCRRETIRCMDLISENQVIKKIEDTLRSVNKPPPYMVEVSKIRHIIERYCQGRGIDLGCGIEKAFPDSLGVDLRPADQVDVIADCININMNGQKYDYVISSHLLEHLASQEVALRNWCNLLKENGYLVLYLPHKNYYTEINPEHLYEYYPEQILVMLRKIIDYKLILCEDRCDGNEYSFLIIVQRRGFVDGKNYSVKPKYIRAHAQVS